LFLFNWKLLTKSFIWGAALYGLERWALGKNEEIIVNAFETW